MMNPLSSETTEVAALTTFPKVKDSEAEETEALEVAEEDSDLKVSLLAAPESSEAVIEETAAEIETENLINSLR